MWLGAVWYLYALNIFDFIIFAPLRLIGCDLIYFSKRMFSTARIVVGISLPPFDGNDTLVLSIATPQKSSKGRGRHPLRIVIVDRENDIALLDDIG